MVSLILGICEGFDLGALTVSSSYIHPHFIFVRTWEPELLPTPLYRDLSTDTFIFEEKETWVYMDWSH